MLLTLIASKRWKIRQKRHKLYGHYAQKPCIRCVLCVRVCKIEVLNVCWSACEDACVCVGEAVFLCVNVCFLQRSICYRKAMIDYRPSSPYKPRVSQTNRLVDIVSQGFTSIPSIDPVFWPFLQAYVGYNSLFESCLSWKRNKKDINLIFRYFQYLCFRV